MKVSNRLTYRDLILSYLRDLPPLQVEIGDDGKIVINQKSLEVTREGNVIRETVEEDNEE